VEGHVYILINSSFSKLVKIGRTSKTPQSRAQELSSTGTPGRFIVAYSVFVNNCIEVEAELHSIFASQRHTSDREFFELETSIAINKLIEITKDRKVMTIEPSPVVGSATFYLLKINESKHIYRVGLIQSAKSYLEEAEFKAMVVDLYQHFDSKFVYFCQTLEAIEFIDVDLDALEKMREIIDENLLRYRRLTNVSLESATYDIRTVVLTVNYESSFKKKAIDEALPKKIYQSTLSLLEPVAKASAQRKLEKLNAIKNAEYTKLLDEKLRRIDRIKKSGI
jgi:hypothetical protein